MLRFLRNAVSVIAVLAIAVLVVMWIRSYKMADCLHGEFREPQSFLIASKEGRVTILRFCWHGASNWWGWETRSYPVEDEMAFPVGSMRQYEWRLGFGTISDPIYFVMPSTITMPDGSQIELWGAATASLNGSGVILPYWFLVLAFGVLAAAPRFRWPPRFSMRAMLIAVTFLAVLFGLVAILDR